MNFITNNINFIFKKFSILNMETNYMYGIIGAMDNEVDTLVKDLENKKEE